MVWNYSYIELTTKKVNVKSQLKSLNNARRTVETCQVPKTLQAKLSQNIYDDEVTSFRNNLRRGKITLVNSPTNGCFNPQQTRTQHDPQAPWSTIVRMPVQLLHFVRESNVVGRSLSL